MKKLLTLLLLLCSIAVFAGVNNKDAVTMEDFEQRWLDEESTIALKNNTNETIHNVSYRITYLDMNGKALDYADYTSTIDIEPGMVKKADIPAYEHERFYQYYKNAKEYDDYPKFKVSFELNDYNFEDASKENVEDEEDVEYGRGECLSPLAIILPIILLVVFILVISIGLYVLAGIMAKRRHRSVALWVIISILTTPILAIIILLCVGDSDEYNHYDK